MCKASQVHIDMETLVKGCARRNLSQRRLVTAVATLPEEPACPWAWKHADNNSPKAAFLFEGGAWHREGTNCRRGDIHFSHHCHRCTSAQPLSQYRGSSRLAFSLSFTSIGFLLSPLWASFASDTRSTNDFFFSPPCSHFNCRVYVIPLGIAIATCIIIYAVKTKLVAIYLLTRCPGITRVNSLILWL